MQLQSSAQRGEITFANHRRAYIIQVTACGKERKKNNFCILENKHILCGYIGENGGRRNLVTKC